MGQGQGLLECGERLHRPAAEGGGGDAQSRRDLLVRLRLELGFGLGLESGLGLRLGLGSGLEPR